jgi:hypothetical protein
MTIDQLELVLTMAFKDPKLAQDLQADPEAKLKSLNYPAHPKEIAFFRALSLAAPAAAVDELKNKDPLAHVASEC